MEILDPKDPRVLKGIKGLLDHKVMLEGRETEVRKGIQELLDREEEGGQMDL